MKRLCTLSTRAGQGPRSGCLTETTAGQEAAHHEALNLLLLVEGPPHTPSPSPLTRRWPRQALTQNLCSLKPALILPPAPSPGEEGSGPHPFTPHPGLPAPPSPLHPSARPARASASQQAAYHDAGVGLVVVGGVHALEPLLACCVPKVCNRNTALTARGGGEAQGPDTEHLRGGGEGGRALRSRLCSPHVMRSAVHRGGRGRRGPGRRTQTGDPTRGRLRARPPPPSKTQGPPRSKLNPIPMSAQHRGQMCGLAKGKAVTPPKAKPLWKTTLRQHLLFSRLKRTEENLCASFRLPLRLPPLI